MMARTPCPRRVRTGAIAMHSRMSALGQKLKGSWRANLFRFSSTSRRDCSSDLRRNDCCSVAHEFLDVTAPKVERFLALIQELVPLVNSGNARNRAGLRIDQTSQ